MRETIVNSSNCASRAVVPQYDESKVKARPHRTRFLPARGVKSTPMMRLAAVTGKVHLRLARACRAKTADRGVTVSALSDPAKTGSADVEAFAHNVARMMEEGGKALA